MIKRLRKQIGLQSFGKQLVLISTIKQGKEKQDRRIRKAKINLSYIVTNTMDTIYVLMLFWEETCHNSSSI